MKKAQGGKRNKRKKRKISFEAITDWISEAKGVFYNVFYLDEKTKPRNVTHIVPQILGGRKNQVFTLPGLVVIRC